MTSFIRCHTLGGLVFENLEADQSSPRQERLDLNIESNIGVLINEACRSQTDEAGKRKNQTKPEFGFWIDQSLHGRTLRLRSLKGTVVNGTKLYRGPLWTTEALKTRVVITPRGFGRSSFMLYECLQVCLFISL